MSKVNIDFKLIGKAVKDMVAEKAIHSGSTIVYSDTEGKLIEEDPKTHIKRVLTKAHI
jgi:hypothetical protein